MCVCVGVCWGGGGLGRGGLTSRFSYPLIPVPALYLLAPASLHFFSTAKYCAMLRSFSNPASRPLFSLLPYTSRPLSPRSPAPVSPPPVIDSYKSLAIEIHRSEGINIALCVAEFDVSNIDLHNPSNIFDCVRLVKMSHVTQYTPNKTLTYPMLV